jgi:hypothetical protein
VLPSPLPLTLVAGKCGMPPPSPRNLGRGASGGLTGLVCSGARCRRQAPPSFSYIQCLGERCADAWCTLACHPPFRYTRDEVVSRTMFNFTAEQEMQETFQIVSDVLSGKAIVSG